MSGRNLKARFKLRLTVHKSVFALLQNANEEPSCVDRLKYIVTSAVYYSVIMIQREIKRLSTPFKSHYVFTENLNKGVFSHSKSFCHESCYARDMLHACGTISDLYVKYYPCFETTGDPSKNK